MTGTERDDVSLSRGEYGYKTGWERWRKQNQRKLELTGSPQGAISGLEVGTLSESSGTKAACPVRLWTRPVRCNGARLVAAIVVADDGECVGVV